jgi:hypothetical protein
MILTTAAPQIVIEKLNAGMCINMTNYGKLKKFMNFLKFKHLQT